MFERFTEGAIKVIMLSQEEAKRMGHGFVGTEQLLLGVIGQRHGIGAQTFQQKHITLRRVRKEIERYIGRGTGFVASEMPFTPRAKRVLEMALIEGREIGQNYVSTEHILLAILNETDGVAMRTLDKLGVDTEELRSRIYENIKNAQEQRVKPLSKSEKYLLRKAQRAKAGADTPTLDEYSVDLTHQALNGLLDPVIGREKEINALMTSLARRSKNNPVLMGEPGVGKTAVAEGLAQLIVNEDVPDFLEGTIVKSLDLGSILAGTKYRGEFEERIKRIVDEVRRDPFVIVVIDEIHTLVGAGAAEGAVDAANILKPALARGQFRCIGATTTEEYKKYIQRDPALERRFQPVVVEEPSVGVTIQILLGLKAKLETHHVLVYHITAIEQAAILADKYIRDRFLPDKAIDLLDEAAARVRLENRDLPEGIKSLIRELKGVLKDKTKAMATQNFKLSERFFRRELDLRTHIRIMKRSYEDQAAFSFEREVIDRVLEEDVANVMSDWTGIPVNKISGSESERLLKLEEALSERIIGQKQAVSSVSKAIRRARVGLRNTDRPIASFIFAGPTGVGKTELTKAVADYMFNGEDSMVRLDMSEYMEKHTVAKLIGSPPGYVGYNEGGQLTEAVRSTPYCVVLFDEVEKAHPDVFNLLLQILDDGRLTDSRGKVVDFTNALIVMTTNLGAKIIQDESGILPKEEDYDTHLKLLVNTDLGGVWDPEPNKEEGIHITRKVNRLVNEELKGFFRPEFLNRIDEIIVFRHLTKVDLWKIAGLMINQLIERLDDKELTLVVDDPVRALLVDEGHDPIYGARPLRRVIMRYLEDGLAENCLAAGDLTAFEKIIVRRRNFRDYKNELKQTKSISEIRRILDNAIIYSHHKRVDFNERKLTSTGIYNLDSLERSARLLKPDSEEMDIIIESVFDTFVNPFGSADEHTYTKELVIELVERPKSSRPKKPTKKDSND